MTHIIPYDNPRLAAGTKRALCGRVVFETQHAALPQCPDCTRILNEEERSLALLREDSEQGERN